MTTLTLEFPFLPKAMNSWMADHWRARSNESKRWHVRIAHEVLFVVGKPSTCPWKRARLTLTRRSSGTMDFDGLVASFKFVVDGLVKCGVLENDKMENIGQPTYLHEKASPGKGGIKIVVEELE